MIYVYILNRDLSNNGHSASENGQYFQERDKKE